jgi:hypothetical protein
VQSKWWQQYIYSNQYINNTACIYKGLLLFRRQKPDPIAIHFNFNEHSVNDYEIVALEKIERQSKNWMNILRTFKPHGLNTKT